MCKQFSKNTDLVQAVIVGGHGFEGQYESLASNPDIVIATPGRLMQHLVITMNYSGLIFNNRWKQIFLLVKLKC